MTVISFGERGFTVCVDFNVVDPQALWDGAVASLRNETNGHGLEAFDDARLDELLGGREHPDPGACLQLLMTPTMMPGCVIQHSTVTVTRRKTSSGG